MNPYPDFTSHAFYCNQHGFVDGRMDLSGFEFRCENNDDGTSNESFFYDSIVCDTCEEEVSVCLYDESKPIIGPMLCLLKDMRAIGVTLDRDLVQRSCIGASHEMLFNAYGAFHYLQEILLYRYENDDVDASILSPQVVLTDACQILIQDRFQQDGALYCVMEYVYYKLHISPFYVPFNKKMYDIIRSIDFSDQSVKKYDGNAFKSSSVLLVEIRSEEEISNMSCKKNNLSDNRYVFYGVFPYERALDILFDGLKDARTHNCIDYCKNTDFRHRFYLYDRIEDAMHAGLAEAKQSKHGMMLLVFFRPPFESFRICDLSEQPDQWDIIVNRPPWDRMPGLNKYDAIYGPISCWDDARKKKVKDEARGCHIAIFGNKFYKFLDTHLHSIMFFIKDTSVTFSSSNIELKNEDAELVE